jgi:hypothetical protein
MILRRNFLVGLFTSVIAAPAIVRAASLMPVRSMEPIEIIRPRGLVAGVPRCFYCRRAFGMCAHTGGPITEKWLADPQLDPRAELV